MRYLLMLPLLLLASCGPGNDANSNDGHAHDHFHSHEGETHPLGTGKAGELTVSAWLKDKLKPGELTVIEVKFEGGAVKLGDLRGDVVGPDGKVVAQVAGFHEMAESGRFGAHVGIPADTRGALTIQFGVADGPRAEFKLPVLP